MEEEHEWVLSLQRSVSNDVIIKNYHYIVGCVNAILIFPYLVSSRVVQQDFRQYLDGERTDKDKMMALLRELTRCPLETWFQEFIGALSKILQYETVVEHLLKDYTELMEERQAHASSEDGRAERRPQAVVCTAMSKPMPDQLVISVAGVDDVMKKTLENAKAGHDAALSELAKARDLVLKAEKGKVCAEVENRFLKERAQEDSKKLSEVTEWLRGTEMDKRLLERESQSYKEEIRMTMQRTELEKTQLAETLTKVRSQEKATRKKVQELEEERTALVSQIAELQDDMARGTRQKEEEVSSLKQQLSDANIQQQTLKEEFKALWQEAEKQRMVVARDRQELDVLRSSGEEGLTSLQEQLVHSASRATTLQGELDKAEGAKKELEERIKGLRKELSMTMKKKEGVQSKREQKKKKEGRGKEKKKENASEEADVKERSGLQELEEELMNL